MIRLEHIRKTYLLGDETVHALDDVSLIIEDREFVAIVGASGSGKSTLMNMIGCLDEADEGEYYIDETNVLNLSQNELSVIRNEKIGFIFQQFNLIPKLNAYENVELPLIYQGLPAVERKVRVLEALDKVGLSDRMHHRPNQLSGGQQQRVAVARALATHPTLILADEPTGNLDSKSSKDIMNLIRELHEQGNTIILITHDNELAEAAPRQVKLFDGKVVKDTKDKDFRGIEHTFDKGSNVADEPKKKGNKGQFLKFRQALRMALSAILSSKMRSFLTMLGIIIGVMAVTLLISLVQGATMEITNQMGTLGGTNVTAMIIAESPKLSLEEVMTLKEEKSVQDICAYQEGEGIAKAEGKQYDAKITGMTDTYFAMKSIEVEQGRGISEIDNEYYLNVCVIGTEVAKELFGQTKVVGEEIRLNGNDYKIVGVLKEEGANSLSTTDTYVYIPLGNAERLLGITGVRTFEVSAVSAEVLSVVEKKVTQFLKAKYREEQYQVFNMGSFIDMIESVYNTLAYLLGGIASISLVVGGIGIMNIMLVSVTERTKEIGIRKAIGAKKADITGQFLIESAILSLMGGIIGMVLSSGILAIINAFMEDYHFSITIVVALLAIGYSIGVGVIFGLYPANKAAKLKPIDALRFE